MPDTIAATKSAAIAARNNSPGSPASRSSYRCATTSMRLCRRRLLQDLPRVGIEFDPMPTRGIVLHGDPGRRHRQDDLRLDGTRFKTCGFTAAPIAAFHGSNYSGVLYSLAKGMGSPKIAVRLMTPAAFAIRGGRSRVTHRSRWVFCCLDGETLRRRRPKGCSRER